jgi:hypothetical protein
MSQCKKYLTLPSYIRVKGYRIYRSRAIEVFSGKGSSSRRLFLAKISSARGCGDEVMMTHALHYIILRVDNKNKAIVAILNGLLRVVLFK